MSKTLTHYKHLANQTLALPTELIQVGFFRNEKKQNQDVIKHNLSKQHYKLNGLYCDTVVETPLFSMMLVEHQNRHLNSEDYNDGEGISLSFSKGSNLLKQLKIKGNYTILQLIDKANSFIEKFKGSSFYVNEKEVKVFEELFISPTENTLCYDFHEDFIAYLNERKKSLTFINNSDLVAIKRKTQTALFIIIQSVNGINKSFFTKRYFADILGITGDVNKKLSVSFNNLKEKHVINYSKEISKPNGFKAPFSRFIIESIDDDFVSKIKKNKINAQNASKNKEIKDKQTKMQSNINFTLMTHSKIKAAANDIIKEDSEKNQFKLDFNSIDELDEAWIISMLDNGFMPYRTRRGTLSISLGSTIPLDVEELTREYISKTKIKKWSL